MAEVLTVRHMRRADLKAVAACERKVHSVAPWDERILAERAGEQNVRVLVAEGADGVRGELVFALEDDGYRVHRLTATDEPTRAALVASLIGRSERNAERKRVTFVVEDGDWPSLSFLVNNKLCRDKPKLLSSPGGPDQWECECRTD